MPFTLSHAAAALPFRRLKLVTSAVVIGTMAPDFEYFLHLAPDSGFGHTFIGVAVLTLPTALLVLWLYQFCVKGFAFSLLPGGMQSRLADSLQPFPFFGAARFLLILASLLVGIATHLAWDSLTHPSMWPYQHWSFLRKSSRLPFVGLMPNFLILQDASTLFGFAVLCIWFAHWYRTTTPRAAAPPVLLRKFSAGRKLYTTVQILVIAAAGAIVRVLVALDVPNHRQPLEHLEGVAVCAFIAVAWWQLVVYGLMSRGRQRFHRAQGV